jgi:hypothetical protein
VTVDYATGGGSATPGDDYLTKKGVLQFNPGQTSKTFSVTIIDNALYEPDKTIGLALSSPGGAELGAPADAILTILNDETLPSSIVNGDFEQGATGWTQNSSHGWTLILEDGEFPHGVHPHGGNWAVWLGGGVDEISSIDQQQVTVPAGAPYLTYYHWIVSEDACSLDFDVAEVIINDSVEDSYVLCAIDDTGGWAKHVVDLSSWVNQSISVKIIVTTDGSLSSHLFVDDVSFEASADAPAVPPTTLFGGEQEALKSRLDLSAPIGGIAPSDADRPLLSGLIRGRVN